MPGADDDQTIRRLVETHLRGDGFHVVGAANGAEAVLCLQRESFDVIVLDLDMPVMNGRAFWRRMKEQGQEIPTLILSAHGAREAAGELGAAAALDKPFDIDELTNVVTDLCHGGRSESAEVSPEPEARTNGYATEGASGCADQR